jgi:transcriptional regulator with XRE-family HTH domain
MKRKPKLDRAELFAAIDRGELGLADTVRRMRASIGLTQTEYARLVGIAPRIIIDLERGAGNPTLASLQKIGRPFGLELAFRRRRAE